MREHDKRTNEEKRSTYQKEIYPFGTKRGAFSGIEARCNGLCRGAWQVIFTGECDRAN